ncbi:NADH:flavin oxidoreductase/NADH oxidase [Daedalea quercina L-15889]|uniref:NADH:flavin oxidoreductase/NADH oxidase n=1 Tax=Daedalea quercina L-15889 TaxID=1314783 RepID=A0A165LA82_9APHY|nr:NADH:flavin oxidoreductase/NADH oxidase [Daedalea quercina L-15889]
MSTTVVPKLFQPVKVGQHWLTHRVVLAPLTRYRANKAHVHGDLAVTYYGQRASIPGTLLITEATFISARAGGYDNIPGIWNDEQVEGWKRVTDAVHEKGSRIYCQLWALGRAADPTVLDREGLPYVSSGDITLTGASRPPRPLTIPEIKEYLDMYRNAARCAVRAGFDGVEIHGANGYLIDQFMQDVSNNRTDEYGGSIENRTRFALEVVDAVVSTIGADKTGIRLSPWSQFQDMRMADPMPTFSYLVSQLAKLHSDLSYIHVVEPRAQGNLDREVQPGESNVFLREIWKPRPYITAGGYTRETAFEDADTYGDLIAFGRLFIPNPDLPLRLAKDLPIVKGTRDLYYVPEEPHGYIDYPFSDDPKANL